ncbi:hypothetical protein [Microbulbifer sp. ANSA005]|uniref:hypothetical protein n=1 Tax=Microbulbifer sp. ANSA005 TaxID=3243362 RepID=UPI00404268E9
MIGEASINCFTLKERYNLANISDRDIFSKIKTISHVADDSSLRVDPSLINLHPNAFAFAFAFVDCKSISKCIDILKEGDVDVIATKSRDSMHYMEHTVRGYNLELYRVEFSEPGCLYIGLSPRSLSPEERETIMNNFSNLWEDRSCLTATHDN